MKKFKKALSLLTAIMMAVTMINVNGIEAFADKKEITSIVATTDPGVKLGTDKVESGKKVATLKATDNDGDVTGTVVFTLTGNGEDNGKFSIENNNELKVNGATLTKTSYNLKVTATVDTHNAKELAVVVTIPAADKKEITSIVATTDPGVKLGTDKVESGKKVATLKATDNDGDVTGTVVFTLTGNGEDNGKFSIENNNELKVNGATLTKTSYNLKVTATVDTHNAKELAVVVTIPAAAPVVDPEIGEITGTPKADLTLGAKVAVDQVVIENLAATNGTGNKTFSIDASDQNQGKFKVEGTAVKVAQQLTEAKTYSIVVKAEDTKGKTKTKTFTVKVAPKTTNTIEIPLPEQIKDRVEEMEIKDGDYGFKLEGSKITQVSIRDGKAILFLQHGIEVGANVKVEYKPDLSPIGKSLRKVSQIKSLDTLPIQKAGQGVEIPAGTRFFVNGSNIDKIKISVSNKPVVKKLDFVTNGANGFTVEKYDNEQTRSQVQNITVKSVDVDRDGKIVLTLNEEINPETLVKVVYTPPVDNKQKLYVLEGNLTAADIPTVIGKVGNQGVIEALPKADTPSGGYSGGSSYRSSVRPGSADRSESTSKVNRNHSTGEKVSTTLVIGQKTYTVMVDGKPVEKMMDVPPMIHMGRTVLPARMISELLGVEVKYDQMTRTANFMYGEDNLVQLTLGQKVMMVNGKAVPLTADIVNISGRILLPLTDIQRAFGELGLKAEVGWDAQTKSVTIEK